MGARSSNLTEELNDIDNYIKGQNVLIQAGKDLEKLKATKEFQNVIVHGYLESETKRLFDMLLSPEDVNRETILNLIDSIKHFKKYIGTADQKGTVEMLAISAPSNIEANTITRSELVSENYNTQEE